MISDNFKKRDDYAGRTQRTLLYFNYTAPSCSGDVRPQTTQTLAGGELIGVDEESDVILIKMYQQPPKSYTPYYAGWNASPSPLGAYSNIHHPNVNTKRLNFYHGTLENTSYERIDNHAYYPFGNQKHWEVKPWSLGTTAGGSSGSPLFDKEGLVIGGFRVDTRSVAMAEPITFLLSPKYGKAKMWGAKR